MKVTTQPIVKNARQYGGNWSTPLVSDEIK